MSSFKDCWDQRIRNEPILARNFLLAQPPIVPFERPVTTLCTKSAPVGRVLAQERLRYSPHDELRLANFWLASQKIGGLLTSDYDLNMGNFAALVAAYPDRPWLQGVYHNIKVETDVKPYSLLDSDCVPNDSLVIIERQRQLTEARTKAREMKMKMKTETPVWDIYTSVRMQQTDNRR